MRIKYGLIHAQWAVISNKWTADSVRLISCHFLVDGTKRLTRGDRNHREAVYAYFIGMWRHSSEHRINHERTLQKFQNVLLARYPQTDKIRIGGTGCPWLVCNTFSAMVLLRCHLGQNPSNRVSLPKTKTQFGAANSSSSFMETMH